MKNSNLKYPLFSWGPESAQQYLLSSETGRITGLLGRNGSGKTALMKIVFGATPLEQKSVRINSISLGTNYLRENVISYLPQQILIPAYASMEKAFSLFKIREEEITKHFREARNMMGLKPGELSGGYLRIFEILLILKSASSFCLLDEPFSGLTPVFIERIKEILLETKITKGIIITDQLYRHVVEVADNLYLLVNRETYQVKDYRQLIAWGYVNAL